jgi:hypothetical protein
LADKAALIAAQGKIGEIRDAIEMKQFQMALRQVEAVTKDVGSNFRDLNILKVEALLGVDRPEDAYNLSNLMVRCLPLRMPGLTVLLHMSRAVRAASDAVLLILAIPLPMSRCERRRTETWTCYACAPSASTA